MASNDINTSSINVSSFTPEKFVELSKQIFDHRYNLLTSDNNWQTIHKQDNLTIEEMYEPNCPIPIIRSTTTINISDLKNSTKNSVPGDLVKFIHNATFEEKKNVYDDLVDHHVIQNINDSLHIARSRFKTMPCISWREFLTLRDYRKNYDNNENDEHIMIVQSVTLDSSPVGKNYVRGISNCSAIVRPITDDKSVYMVRTVDHILPCGWIPNFAVNAYKTKVGFKLLKLVEYFKSS